MILPIVLLVFVIVIIRVNSGAASMTIRPVELTRETREVLDILEDEVIFLNYAVDETMQSRSVELWQCEDGCWRVLGSSSADLTSSRGEIALRISEKNCGVFDVDDGGHAGVSWDISDSHTKQEAWTGYRLSEPTDIQAGKEITLWAKYGYRDSESIGISTSNFRSATCDFGLAVTVKFWGEKVD